MYGRNEEYNKLCSRHSKVNSKSSVSKLMSSGTVLGKRSTWHLLHGFILRFLMLHGCLYNVIGENEQNNYNVDYSYLSQYSVSFERCQRVRYYSNYAAQDEDLDGPLATKQFIVFRLCDYSDWTNNMSVSSNQRCAKCNSNYGEYVMEASDYLEATTAYSSNLFEQTCENCNSYQCPTECQYLNNDNILDAAEFINCQQVGETDDGVAVYAGPRCSADGSTVRIAAFSDANCWYQMNDFDLKSILGSSIKHHLFQHATRNGRSCFSCAFNYADQTCDSLYSMAGKCETKHGFNGMMSDYASDDQVYENQLANEYDVCTFIDSITSGGYDNYQGYFVVRSKRLYFQTKVTETQRISLLCLSLVISSLSIYIMYLHSYISVHVNWLGKSCSKNVSHKILQCSCYVSLDFYTCRSDGTGVV